ncbi:glutaredoxin family protein [Halalkalibacterium ligniniphilum]|uniref:glutaredoxin family protein n=1 Tax=Halalkalibacterium ligniniphilum TaxID=1134413 RepID=UPI00034C4F23|nr:glutaredoxin family protein [Halalkalibacterium ligniniphilum]
MVEVTFYTKEQCPLCEKGFTLLKALQRELSFSINVIDIYQEDALVEKYGMMIPVVAIDNEEIDFGILSEEKIRKRLLKKIG